MMEPAEKQYDPNDRTLTIVQRNDDITGDDDPIFRAEMSCGHAVGPDTLTKWCRSQISDGYCRFCCPAAKDGTDKRCNKEWSYEEVRKLALLTEEEQQYFEKEVALLTAANNTEYKQCPGCQSYVERKSLSNLSVVCPVCTAKTGKLYEFCWQCLKEWKGQRPRSDRCDNEGCTDLRLEILKNCNTKSLPNSNIRNCPAIRACPKCGVIIQHIDKCKYVSCKKCHVTFCFACLETEEVCKNNYKSSDHPVAQRQTRIPVRNHTPATTSRNTASVRSAILQEIPCTIM